MPKPKRPYVKRAPYWSKPRTQVEQPAAPVALSQAAPVEFTPTGDGLPHFSAVSACGGGDVAVNTVRNPVGPQILDTLQYPNIRMGITPFQLIEGNYSANDAISLIYQAQFNFALLRNAIKLIVDFAVGKIHVKTPNKRVKAFFETWFDAINLDALQSQYQREKARSGNVFLYKFSGKISEDGFNMLKESMGTDMNAVSPHEARAAKSPTIPIRYIILNPMQVYLNRGQSFDYGYVRMLSTYEIQRLKNPQTEEDKQVFNSFPEDIQRQIKQGGGFRYMFVPLDQNRLYYDFYDKQDYEPLAIPPFFAVLNDIEMKLQLRRMDMTLISTMEQVILLVTAGQKADEYNQVGSARQLAALQDIFSNQAVGRVLVSDHTTKAEWLIPDIKELLGPDKYVQVDKDIREGLQYVFFGDEKFANASIKIKIFIESLREYRRAFLNTFLMPEVKKVCEAMRFKNIPDLEFEEIKMQDDAVIHRLLVQMAQLGMLTPDETFTAMKTGLFPTKEESLEHQTEYKGERNKDLFKPLVGANPDTPPQGGGGMNGRPPGSTGTPAPRKIATPIGQSKAGDMDRDSKWRFGAVAIAKNITLMQPLREKVEAALLKRFKLKELSEAQKGVAVTMAQSIIFNEPEDKWLGAVKTYVKAPKNLPAQVAQDLAEIRATFGTPEKPVDAWAAAILHRSQVVEPKG